MRKTLDHNGKLLAKYTTGVSVRGSFYKFIKFIANYVHTVSHFCYIPIFQGPHFLSKMLESNILYDNLFIDILSVG